MFKKKNKEPEYTMYEADDFYADQEENEENYGYDKKVKKTKEKKKKKLKNSKTQDENNYYSSSYEDYKKNKKIQWPSKIAIVLGIYLVFILIGIFSTSFTTNDIDQKQAQIITVQLREERNSYYALKSQYLDIKSMLENIDKLDIQLSQSSSGSTFTLTTQYQNILPYIDKKLTKAKAVNVDEKYDSLKMQSVDTYQDAATYLQKISSALTSQDEITYEEAITWREKTAEDFISFKNNMTEFANYVKIDDKEFTSTNSENTQTSAAVSNNSSVETTPSQN